MVSQDGHPRTDVMVARYRAPRPAMLPAPGRLRVRRINDTLRVSWRAVAGAASYLIDVRVGRRRVLHAIARRTAVTVTGVPITAAVTVTVAGRRRSHWAGAPGRRAVRISHAAPTRSASRSSRLQRALIRVSGAANPGMGGRVPDTDIYPWERPLGARVHDAGTHRSGSGRRARTPWRSAWPGSEHALADVGHGVFEAIVPATAGDDYWFLIDGERLPDPCSRWQPEGLRGPSRLLDDPPRGHVFRPVPLAELVVYELHVGTFSTEGTFDGAIAHLPELAALGITAIELMPVAEFPGPRGWGYDGVYISASQSSYGGPEGLRRLIRAAHDLGLSVILDVVYNHLGASGVTAMEAYGPYFTAKYETPWGKAINYDDAECDAVREWVLQSAEGWIRDFDLDGLRLDAIHAIFDSSPEHIVAAISRRVHAAKSGALVIAESGLNDPKVMRGFDRGGWGADAAWADDFHHALTDAGHRRATTATTRISAPSPSWPRHFIVRTSTTAATRRFGTSVSGAAADDIAPEGFVVFCQDHDQVGNRAFGDRLPAAARPLAAFCYLLSPFTPMLFMGEEYGEPAPFQFFSSHIDRRSQPPPVRAAAASSPPLPPSAMRSPIPRTRRPSMTQSSPASATQRSRACTASCWRCAASWPGAIPTPPPGTSRRAGCACAAVPLS